MTPTTTSPALTFIWTLNLILITLFFSACTADDVQNYEKPGTLVKELTSSKASVYKGVFASHTSAQRGIFELKLPRGKNDLDVFNGNASGTLTLATGETFEARSSELVEKSSDFLLYFESEDLSFNFSLDENDQPLITNVIFKKESSSILAAEETEESPVTPITGTYSCTNCENQNTSVNGIELNNRERTFNMLLTTADGKTNVNIQALVGILVDTKLVVNESCTTNEDYTFCVIKSGEGLTTEPLTWTGVHRYTTVGGNTDDCAGISGIFEFLSVDLGSIKGEFMSDSKCPTTYFISPSGSDTNSGISPQDPWKTISKINSIDLQPGDEVLFEGDQTYEGNIYLDENDANDPNNPVRISSYGSGRAMISSGLSDGLMAYNTSGIIVDNLIFSGKATTEKKNSGIHFYNDLPGDVKLNSVRITNCEVYGYRDSGIVIGSWNKISGFNDVLIENNKVHDILDAGISSYGEFSASKVGYAHSNVTVRNCEVYNIPGYNKGNNSGNGIVLSDVQHSVIEYCTAYNSGSGNAFSEGGPVGIWYWDADQVTIQYNEVYGMASGTNKDGGGFDLDGGVTNGIIQYNYSHDNEGAGYLIGQFSGARPMNNITVRYNISENDAATNGGSVFLFNGESAHRMKNIFVHNNTLVLTKKRYSGVANIKYIVWKPVKDNIHFYNNILYASNGAALIDIPTGYDGHFAGNLYFSTSDFKIKFHETIYNSLEAFRSTGKEIYESNPAGYQGDPLLNDAGNGGIIGFGNPLNTLNAYKINDASPATDSGIDVPFDKGSRDFYGNNLPSGILKLIGSHLNTNDSSL